MAGFLSGAELQMLAIGRALIAGLRIMLLGEPSMGLAPLVVTEWSAWRTCVCGNGFEGIGTMSACSLSIACFDAFFAWSRYLLRAKAP
jgi:ABC-type transport system involved in cytochrome bd biosynthesis fused ATPase/permease subunit